MQSSLPFCSTMNCTQISLAPMHGYTSICRQFRKVASSSFLVTISFHRQLGTAFLQFAIYCGRRWWRRNGIRGICDCRLHCITLLLSPTEWIVTPRAVNCFLPHAEKCAIYVPSINMGSWSWTKGKLQVRNCLSSTSSNSNDDASISSTHCPPRRRFPREVNHIGQ